MITTEQLDALIEEFPELGSADVLLVKEMYAHFGFLFFKFSLIEHSLINALTFHYAGDRFAKGAIKSRHQWETVFDKGYDIATDFTFGNLVRRVVAIKEFKGFADDLVRAKEYRDYFAHHFFRKEASVYISDEGCWHLLLEFQRVRQFLMKVEDSLRKPFEDMCARLKLPIPSNDQANLEKRRLQDEAARLLRSESPTFGWSD